MDKWTPCTLGVSESDFQVFVPRAFPQIHIFCKARLCEEVWERIMDHAEGDLKLKNKTRILEAFERVSRYPHGNQKPWLFKLPWQCSHVKNSIFSLNMISLEPPSRKTSKRKFYSGHWWAHDVGGKVGKREADPNSLVLCIATCPCTAFSAVKSLRGSSARCGPLQAPRGFLEESSKRKLFDLCVD